MASNDSVKFVTSGQYLDRQLITWKIENFEQIRRSDELINSQRIRIDLGHNCNIPTEWICRLQPKSEDNEEIKVKNVGVFLLLKKVPEGCKDVIVSLELRIDKSNYHAQYVRNFMKDGEIITAPWGFTKVVPSDAQPENVLQDGCLLLELELKLFPATPSEQQMTLTPDQVENQYRSTFSEKLQRDLMKLADDPFENKNCQMKILTKDGAEISVVAVILSARSAVFENMFKADMEESKSGLVKVPDLGLETVLVLLQFIYTGTLATEWKLASVLPELLYAAGKYQLPDLMAFLDDVTGKVCTKENAGKLIGQARKLGMKQAEKELMDFMRKNMSSLDELISYAEDCTVSNLFVNWLG